MVQCCSSLELYGYILIFFFNKLVIFLIFGLWKVNVVQIFFVILASFFFVDFVYYLLVNFPQHLLLKLTRQILHKVNNKTPENTYDPTLYNNPEEYYLTRTLCEGLNIYIMSYYMLLHSSRHSGCSVRRNACANQDHLLPDPYLFNIHESPSPSFVNT